MIETLDLVGTLAMFIGLPVGMFFTVAKPFNYMPFNALISGLGMGVGIMGAAVALIVGGA